MKLLMLVLSLLLLSSCDQQKMLERFSSPPDQAATKYYIDQLEHRNFDAIEAAADDSIKSPSLRSTLEEMAALLPQEPPQSVKLVGAHSITYHGDSQYTLVNTTFEYQYPNKWVVINVAFKKQGDTQTIVGFNVAPRTQSLEAENAFSLSGKNTVQYLVLGSAVMAALLSLYALVVCVRTKLPRRKWLWVLFILLGLGKLSVNWTTSQLDIQLLAFQIFGAGAVAQIYGPWIISVSVPLGAIMFLMRRRRLIERTAEHEQA